MTVEELTNKKEKLLEQISGNADWSSLNAIGALSAGLAYDPQYDQREDGIKADGNERRASVSVKGWPNRLGGNSRCMGASYLIDDEDGRTDAEIYEWAFNEDNWLEGVKLLMEVNWLEKIWNKL